MGKRNERKGGKEEVVEPQIIANFCPSLPPLTPPPPQMRQPQYYDRIAMSLFIL